MADDVVTHNGQTCPLDPLDVEDIYLGRSDGGEGLLVVALAVVAAERARLIPAIANAIEARIDWMREEGETDLRGLKYTLAGIISGAVTALDATTRRA